MIPTWTVKDHRSTATYDGFALVVFDSEWQVRTIRDDALVASSACTSRRKGRDAAMRFVDALAPAGKWRLNSAP